MSVLKAEGISLRLSGRTVLDAVSAAFKPGQVTAVLGPNGAGKSTLLSCLAGLHTPDEGRVMIGGRPRATLGLRDLARQIGLLPQGADVHWDVDVATLVALGRYPHRTRWGETKADRIAVASAMAATDVAQFAARPMTALSGGERARVLLARVLAGEPQWLLADEPLANLDPAHQLDTLECLRDVARSGAGVIVVLHDLNHAIRVADEVLLMCDGRIVAQGALEDVLTPQSIATTYGVSSHIGTTPDGLRFIVTTPMVR
ncbi:ABC transporter ATP-binding protein [Sphingobium sp. D43FB]|uniref:ABC transporter ATP-binding protein n=1 Tax=Sphingobium sp. D43FB TaxID=2017595 RepID=UPI000BB58254|nr:ABC transporter ATP-binding protein [Sphingobium sp. D43FB]PBN41832.1 ABC transporter [Sphingobium sp. D43FB]